MSDVKNIPGHHATMSDEGHHIDEFPKDEETLDGPKTHTRVGDVDVSSSDQ